MFKRCVGDCQIKLAIAAAPVVLTPRHFIGIRREIWPGDMMVCADFRAA